MADNDVTDAATAAAMKARRSFKKFSYRGVELDQLLDLSNEQVRLSPPSMTSLHADADL
jgi:small subunit ribosomal protein S15e